MLTTLKHFTYFDNLHLVSKKKARSEIRFLANVKTCTYSPRGDLGGGGVLKHQNFLHYKVDHAYWAVHSGGGGDGIRSKITWNTMMI
jgi:hypothetical protein